jgi:hypothetical protein
MQRSLFGLLLVGLFGAVLGAVLSWPEGATQSAISGATLSEFQARALTVRRPADVNASSPSPNDEPGSTSADRTAAAAAPVSATAEAGHWAGPDSAPPAPTVRVASAHALHRMPGAGGATQSRPPASQAISDMQREDGGATKALVPGADGKTLEVASLESYTGPPAITDTLQPSDSTSEITDTGRIEQPQAQAANKAATEIAHLSAPAGRHFKQISIHYRGNARSRTDAQKILGQLESADAGKVAMHSTAQAVASSEVRYFSPPDYPAAKALAQLLASKSTIWRVKDCTTFRRKPPPGTVQIWLASIKDPRQPTRKASR